MEKKTMSANRIGKQYAKAEGFCYFGQLAGVRYTDGEFLILAPTTEKLRYFYEGITENPLNLDRVYSAQVFRTSDTGDQQIFFDLITHIKRQREFSEKTFGPGARAKGVVDHIRKELLEIEQKPDDLEEWVDVILLALDGAWRAGHSAEEIAAAIEAKQSKNENRSWPDWRTATPDKAIEHIEEGGGK